MKKVTLNIDGKKIEADEGMTILEAARGVGIEIPTMCYLERLAPYGGCRLCTVELIFDNRTKLVTSCVYEVEEGLVVKTKSDRLSKIRKMILELLLPLAPSGPIETLAKEYGLKKSRFTAEPNFCVLCGLCVRYCSEIKKANAVCFTGRGVDKQITFVPGVAQNICPVCRECVPLCPAGLLASEIEQVMLTPKL